MGVGLLTTLTVYTITRKILKRSATFLWVLLELYASIQWRKFGLKFWGTNSRA